MKTSVMEKSFEVELNSLDQINSPTTTEIQEYDWLKEATVDTEEKTITEKESTLKFAVLETRHAEQIARLHIEGISTGFISSLGIGFVTALYQAIIQTKTCFGFVTEDDKVLGFVAFSTNIGKLYKSIVLKKSLRFAFILARKMLSLQRMKKVFETLFYPSRIKKMNLPSAELLSIVIAPQARKMGLATQLIKQGFEQYQKEQINKVKVLVAANNKAANKLYLKCGFEFAEQIDSHGVPSNIYVAETAKVDQFSRPPKAEIQFKHPLIKYLVEKPNLVAAVA